MLVDNNFDTILMKMNDNLAQFFTVLSKLAVFSVCTSFVCDVKFALKYMENFVSELLIDKGLMAHQHKKAKCAREKN